jgi:hypothetical protein
LAWGKKTHTTVFATQVPAVETKTGRLVPVNAAGPVDIVAQPLRPLGLARQVEEKHTTTASSK